MEKTCLYAKAEDDGVHGLRDSLDIYELSKQLIQQLIQRTILSSFVAHTCKILLLLMIEDKVLEYKDMKWREQSGLCT